MPCRPLRSHQQPVQLHPRVDAELLVDLADVGVHRGGRDAQGGGSLLVGVAARQQAQQRRLLADTDPEVLATIEQERLWNDMVIRREEDPEWTKNNLEYDLRSTKWICDKAKASESYAQNIYAALCNQDWQKNDVWPLLKGETYSCSWRYAGGIVADMIEQGDYIDWYCSGIRGGDEPDVYNNTKLPGNFVSEGAGTDENCEDFFKLGWIPVENNENE